MLEDYGGFIPAVNLNLSKRYDENKVIVYKRDHDQSIKDQVHSLVQELGGVDKVVNQDDKVLLKVNATHPRTVPEGAVVDPQLTYAVIEECFKAGANEVYLGDGTSKKKGTAEVFRDLGYQPILDTTGAKILDLNQPPYIRVDVPFAAGMSYKSYIFTEQLREFDVLISIAKMKTHSEAQVTLGMKNLVGMLPEDPFFGANRKIIHKKIDIQNAAEEIGLKEKFKDYLKRKDEVEGEKYPNDKLCRVIVDLNLTLPISLTIVDGVIGMEGKGPWSGNAICTNVLLAGYNVLATDSVAATIMGFDPIDIKKFQYAQQMKLGTVDKSQIELIGDDIEELKQKYQLAVM